MKILEVKSNVRVRTSSTKGAQSSWDLTATFEEILDKKIKLLLLFSVK